MAKENFETFKDELISILEDRLDPGYTLRTDMIKKHNGINKTGLTLQKGIEDSGIAPTIYVEDLYKEYNGYNMTSIVEETLSNLVIRSDVSVDLDNVMSLDYIKENAYLKVINTESNYDYLMDKPYISLEGFEDLSAVVILRVDITTDNGDLNGNTVVDDSMLEILDISKSELFEIAKANSMEKDPARFESMRTVLMKNMGITEDDPMADFFPPDDGKMNVLMNKSMMFGASTIMYDGIMEDIHGKLGEDFVIIPSSIHEVIIIPESVAPVREELLGLIREVNAGVVDSADKLSDNAYMYSGATVSVSMITDSEATSGAFAD